MSGLSFCAIVHWHNDAALSLIDGSAKSAKSASPPLPKLEHVNGFANSFAVSNTFAKQPALSTRLKGIRKFSGTGRTTSTTASRKGKGSGIVVGRVV